MLNSLLNQIYSIMNGYKGVPFLLILGFVGKEVIVANQIAAVKMVSYDQLFKSHFGKCFSSYSLVLINLHQTPELLMENLDLKANHLK